MTDNKSVMKVKIMKEAGFEEAMMAIALNKKKYDRDMYPVSKKLALAGGGHNKFLQMISVWVDYTTCRSIHQQIDTYRVGVTKSSESTHHMLIEDVLETSIDRKEITADLKNIGINVNTERITDGIVPINNTALLIAKLNDNTISNKEEIIKEYFDKYLISTTEFNSELANKIAMIMTNHFAIDYDKYYSMFEGGSEAITKDMVDKMVELAMTLEEDRYGKLHKLKRMLPEGFLQRRIMSCNYASLKCIISQRMSDNFVHWQEFCKQILLQVQHPEYFDDIFEQFHTSREELAKNMCNGKPYGLQ